MIRINQEKVEEMKKNVGNFIRDNGPIFCYGIGVCVGVMAGAVIVGSKAKAKGYDLGYKEALELVNETRDGIVDILVNHDAEHNCALLQLTKHSLAGDFTVQSALTADMARKVSNVLTEVSDIIDNSVTPSNVVNF